MVSCWHWLFGYVVCCIRRGERQALLNLLLEENVEVWDVVELPDTGTVTFCLSLRDYRRIVKKLKRHAMRIQIVDKRGLPFYLWRAQQRKSFWAGAFGFIVLLSLVFQIVWAVDVVGNEQIPTDELLNAVAQLGVKEGVFRHRLPSRDVLQAELLSRFPGLTWVGVEQKGTKVVIRVVEGKRPEPAPLSNPRHLVAAKSAIVKDIFVEQGTARVTRNQRVKKGEVLIAGYMGNEENRRTVSAKGTVHGLVWYEVSASVPLVQRQYRLSGERFQKRSLLIGNRLVSFGPAAPPFQPYKVDEVVRRWQVGPWTLPIGMLERTYYKTVVEQRGLTRQEALALAKERARDDLLRQLDDHAEIIMEKVLQETVVSGTLKVKLYYEVLEEITKELPIIPEEQPRPTPPQESA